MKISLRPQSLDEVLARIPDTAKRREITINPGGGFFDAKNLSAAIRRASDGDLILLPPGEYPGGEVKKSVELRPAQPGTVVIRGSLKVSGEIVRISGLEIYGTENQPAVIVEKGTAILDDCTVHGGVTAGLPNAPSRLFLRNCLLENAVESIVLHHGASIEISTTRIAKCKVGLSLSNGASGAIYNSRIETCQSKNELEPGAGIFAENATIYCEGVSFSQNDVGVYVTDCPDAKIIASHFHGHLISSLILSGSAASNLLVHTSSIDGQKSARCAQIALSGGTVSICHSVIKAAPAPAVAMVNAKVEIFDARFSAHNMSAIEARDSEVNGSGLICESAASYSIAAENCEGTIRLSTFTGPRPADLTDSPQLLFESCKSLQPQPNALPNEEASPEDLVATEVFDLLRKEINQEQIRNELERILRLAHAGRRRKMEGLPVPMQSYHSVFLGGAGTGKRTAARLLAQGLHAFEVIANPALNELTPSNHSVIIETEGLVLVPARASSSGDPTDLQATLEKLVGKAGNVVVVEGEREDVRKLLRSNPALGRVFRNTLHFADYGPIELTALFVRLCERDHIPVSADTSRNILLAFHYFCDRKDKRFSNTEGVNSLYEAARRRYLERCSLANRFDLELETRDFDVPQDKAFLAALDRSPAFVTFCPVCSRENPWLPGLGRALVCLHCSAPYSSAWGLWKGSASHRRAHDIVARVEDPATQPRRTNLPSRNPGSLH